MCVVIGRKGHALLTVQTLKDLPTQFVRSSRPLQVKLLLASFGAAKGYSKDVFTLAVKADQIDAAPEDEKPLRYGKLAEIHHEFRADPTSPPKIVSIVFAAAVLGTVPLLFGTVSRAMEACAHELIVAVGRAWGERRAHFASVGFGASVTRAIRRIDCGARGRFLPVLHQLEPLPDAARGCGDRGGDVLCGYPGAQRGAAAAPGGSEMRSEDRRACKVGYGTSER